jgi:hypothetical protein
VRAERESVGTTNFAAPHQQCIPGATRVNMTAYSWKVTGADTNTALALAVLRGDRQAALALADKVLEEYLSQPR